MPPLHVRLLTAADRPDWEPLWLAYLGFYKTALAPEITDCTWARFHDPAEPMWALGAFEGSTLLGFSHYIFQRSCWTLAPSCYLQDLFTVHEARGRGIGGRLIEAVRDAAREAGSARVHWLTQEDNATARALYEKVAMRSGFIQYQLPV